MKIVQFEKQKGWSGQAQQSFLAAKGLHLRGHKVLMVCQSNSIIGKEAENSGIAVIYLPMVGLRLFLSAIRLGLYLRKNKYDILHSHGARDHLLSIISCQISGNGKVLRSKHNMKKVRRGWLQYNYFTNSLSAVSRPAYCTLEEIGIPQSKIRLIYSSFDLSRFSPHDPSPEFLGKLNISRSNFVIGTMGRLTNTSKGTEILLRAAPIILEEFPDARFLLVGHPGKKLPRLADRLNISDRVIFPGFTEDVSGALCCMDLYVQPSITEALSSSIIQAMAMQKPVVASDTGGIPEVVDSGKTALLCTPGDPEALAQTILGLIKDKNKLLEMGSLGRKRALEKFSLDRMIDDIEAWYRQVLQKPES